MYCFLFEYLCSEISSNAMKFISCGAEYNNDYLHQYVFAHIRLNIVQRYTSILI